MITILLNYYGSQFDVVFVRKVDIVFFLSHIMKHGDLYAIEQNMTEKSARLGSMGLGGSFTLAQFATNHERHSFLLIRMLRQCNNTISQKLCIYS